MGLMSPRTMIRCLALTALAGTAACSTLHVDPFLEQPIRGDSFTDHLAREYQRRARSERTVDEDWVHAGRLAKKGKLAMDGTVVEPWVPVEWNILPVSQPALDDARGRLMDRLVTGRDQTPEACAKAQVYFDGWLEQSNDNDLGEGWLGIVQADRAAAEQAAFEDILPLCGGTRRVEEPVPVRAPSTEQRFIVYFGWNRTDLTTEAVDLIEGVVDYLSEIEGASVTLDGHTDSSGTEAYNVGLSRRRADQVRAALEAGGLAVNDVDWFGEARPAVPTGDGVREPLNRRVEVTVVRPGDL